MVEYENELYFVKATWFVNNHRISRVKIDNKFLVKHNNKNTKEQGCIIGEL